MSSEKSDLVEEPTKELQTVSSVRKNFILIALAFVFVFTAYNGTINLQSSINSEKNVGFTALTINAAFSILSCLFITNPLVFLAGYKWTMFISETTFLIFVASNIYPKAWLLYPASALCGIFRATLGTAQCSYVAGLGRSEAQICGRDQGSIVNRYFAIFCSALQSSQIWGNLMAYLFLQHHSDDVLTNTGEFCGANYSNNDLHELTSATTPISMNIIVSLYTTFVIMVVVSLIFISSLADQKQNMGKMVEATGFFRSSFEYTMMTLRQMKNPMQILLLPLPFWLGTTEAFLFSVFTNSFITCSIGIQYVGLIMLTFGVTAGIFSLIIGNIVYYALLVTMLLWRPNLIDLHIFYVLVGIAGMTGAIWSSFIPALHGYLFPLDTEAAFSNMILSQNIGNLVVFFYGGILLTRTTIILQIIYLSIATCCYLIVEIKDRGSKYGQPLS